MRLLLDKDQLQAGVARMAEQIFEVYRGESPTIVGILTGSIVLLADIIRLLDLPLRVGLVQARSYRGATTTRGHLVINADLLPDIAGCDVLLVDDIFDTGHTLAEMVARIRELGPSSIRSAVLLRKHGRQEVDLQPDFVGFDIPNEFVVGYGLDYHNSFRNLPYVAALDPEEISSSAP